MDKIKNKKPTTTVAGCMVTKGKILRSGNARLVRNGHVIWTESLRHMKDNVKEITNGHECGIVLKDFNDIQSGDVIQCFEIIEEKK